MPVRTDVTPEDLGLEAGSVDAKINGWADNYVFWVDNSLSAECSQTSSIRMLPLVLTGKMTPEELVAQLDKVKVQQ